MAVRSHKYSVFDIVVFLLVLLSVIICILPCLYVVAESFSSNNAIVSQKVLLWPVEFTTQAYNAVFSDSSMVHSLIYSVGLTLASTAMSMLTTILAAYPLTKQDLKGRNFFLVLFMLTMYFSGGIIPDYLLVQNLHIMNTVWSLLLPGLMSVYNMIILKSFFQSLPPGLTEAASLDGCTEFGILFRIVLPLSLPAIATLSLFYAVGRWNGFQDALYYITNPDLYPIQQKLYLLITVNQQLDLQEGRDMGLAPEGLKAASVVFATVPVLLIYPWLQKYFVSGVMLGAIKG